MNIIVRTGHPPLHFRIRVTLTSIGDQLALEGMLRNATGIPEYSYITNSSPYHFTVMFETEEHAIEWVSLLIRNQFPFVFEYV